MRPFTGTYRTALLAPGSPCRQQRSHSTPWESRTFEHNQPTEPPHLIVHPSAFHIVPNVPTMTPPCLGASAPVTSRLHGGRNQLLSLLQCQRPTCTCSAASARAHVRHSSGTISIKQRNAEPRATDSPSFKSRNASSVSQSPTYSAHSCNPARLAPELKQTIIDSNILRNSAL